MGDSIFRGTRCLVCAQTLSYRLTLLQGGGRSTFNVPNNHLKISRAAALIAAIPWWLWLLFGVGAWLIARGMIGLKPAPPLTPVKLLHTSLLQLAGNVLSLTGPIISVLLAIASGRIRAKSRLAQFPDRQEPILSDGDATSRQAWDTTKWSLPLLRALEWKRLEQLSAVYFRTLKFRVEEAKPGPDGGVDLKLFSGTSASPGVLVQCKAWSSWKVGVKEIRELFGVMAAEGVDEGILVTTSSFSKDAVDFARGKNIALIDGEDLLSKLLSLPLEDQAHMLMLATSGDFTTPTCPSCGIKMVMRMAQGTGDAFWGCSRFPLCRSRIGIARRPAVT